MREKRRIEEIERRIVDICRLVLLVLFVVVTLYVVWLCMFSQYISEYVIARALPLSVVLMALATLFWALSGIPAGKSAEKRERRKSRGFGEVRR